MKFAQISLVLLASASLGGCQPDPHETQINAKLKSPDGKLTAIYAEDLGGGPATGVSEDVYIVDGDRFPRLADRVFSNECVQNVRLAWGQASTLRIDYDAGRDVQVDVRRHNWSIFPWLWGSSPASNIKVNLVRHITNSGGC